MIKKRAIIFLILFTSMLQAQEVISVSLNEAVAYAMEHNNTVKNAVLDIEDAKLSRYKQIATGLPKVKAKVAYQNWLKQQVSLIPAEFFGGVQGDFIEVAFGTEQSISGTITLEQLIFDGSYIVALQSSKIYLQISRLGEEKTKKGLRDAIINAYGNVLLVEELLKVSEKNKKSLAKIIFETEETYKNGLIEEENVEQLKLTLASLNSYHSKNEKLKKVAYQMLKILLGYDASVQIKLTDTFDNLITETLTTTQVISETFNVQNHIDYRISDNNLRGKKLLHKYELSFYLPTIKAFVNKGLNAYSNDFSFFKSEQDWFDSSLFGVSVDIPIFTSFSRRSTVKQAKLEINKAKNLLEDTENNLQLNYEKAKAEFEYSLEEFKTSKQNIALAEKIEKKQSIKFSEGISSSFELTEAQRQLYTAQQNYFQTMLSLIVSKSGLELAMDSITLTTPN